MSDIDLTGAHEYCEQYLRCVDEAVNAEDPDDARMSIGDALMVGQMVLDVLEEAMASPTAFDCSDQLDEVMHLFILSMDTADQAIEVGDEDLGDLTLEMKRHADVALHLLTSSFGSRIG